MARNADDAPAVRQVGSRLVKQISAAAAALAAASMLVICLLAISSAPEPGGVELQKAAVIAAELRPYLEGAIAEEWASARQQAVNEVLEDALETYPSISALSLIERQGGRFSRSRETAAEPEYQLRRWLGGTVIHRPEVLVA